MLKAREIATAAGTLACAVGIGFIMQNGDTAKERYGAQTPVLDTETVQADVISAVVNADLVLEVQDITLTSAQTAPLPETSGVTSIGADTGVQLAAANGALETPAQPDVVPLPSCDIVASAQAAPGAMIDLSLSAPCLPNERVNVHHQGLVFTQTTKNDGSLNLSLPALAQDATVIFAFSDGDGAVTSASVDDLDMYNRTALQWRGDAGFQIHAREFGAAYGEDGHVWVGAPAAQGDLTRLGDATVAEPFMAEIYSFPRMSSTSEGTIDLSVEAEVTRANCGLEIEAQSLEVSSTGIKTQDLTLAVPDCDALGDFLVLNNLVQDLKVASN